jgi:hypothetical protein
VIIFNEEERRDSWELVDGFSRSKIKDKGKRSGEIRMLLE